MFAGLIGAIAWSIAHVVLRDALLELAALIGGVVGAAFAAEGRR